MGRLAISLSAPLSLLLTFLQAQEVLAQVPQRIEATPTNGKLNSSLRKKAYRYPGFIDSKVLFNNGTYTQSKLNYNVLSGEMEFINSQNDTLALDNLFTISLIEIGEENFVYDQAGKKLLKVVRRGKNANLYVHEKYEITNMRSKGALGSEPSSLPATSAREYFAEDGVYDLSSNTKLTYSAKSTFHLGNKNNTFVAASKRNTLKLFPKYKTELTNYFAQHNVDFDRQEDLEALLLFLDTLASE